MIYLHSVDHRVTCEPKSKTSLFSFLVFLNSLKKSSITSLKLSTLSLSSLGRNILGPKARRVLTHSSPLLVANIFQTLAIYICYIPMSKHIYHSQQFAD